MLSGSCTCCSGVEDSGFSTKKMPYFSAHSEWTEAFTNDFRDEVMMMHFKDITTYCGSLSTDLKKIVSQVTQSLFCKLAMLDKYDEVLAQATAAAEDRRRTNSSKYKSVLEVCTSPPEMAQQLSHIELERLANIGPEEFVETFISRDDVDFKWPKVKNKKFDRLEREMNPGNNFGAYRKSFKSAHGRKDEMNEYVIPFFGLFLKDVYFLNEGYTNR
ncbi:hypothetical protein QZH41_017864 [Actinostola sp. cb2023]|nr:hypothetical protein QZH41_017864 [Actinostola sp. cb2023]